MRIVLDTNVLLICLLKTSKYRPIFEALIRGKYGLVITNEILLEYAEIIESKTNSDIAKNVIDTLLNLVNVKKIDTYFRWNLIIDDPDDNKFIDCAIAGNVTFVVTNDKHFNALKNIEFPKVNVISASQFLLELEKGI